MRKADQDRRYNRMPRLVGFIVLGILGLTVSACTAGPTVNSAPGSLDVTIEGLPELVPADVTIEGSGGSFAANYTTTLYDVPQGSYNVRATALTDDPNVTFLPDLVEGRIRVPADNSITVRYVPACTSEDSDARENCTSLPWYPQGYVTQNREITVEGSVQVFNGSIFEARSLGSVETTERYFTFTLPPVLSDLRLDSITNVMKSISFQDDTVCERDVVIGNPSIRGNDLFLDAYDTSILNEDPPEEGEESTQPESRIGEVFLYDRTNDQLVLWIFANGQTTVRGYESCDGLGDLNFNLDLEYGWNLVGLSFTESDSGASVDIERIDGFVDVVDGAVEVQAGGRAFGIMPADYDAESDPDGPAPSVFPGDYADMVNRPFGYLNLPLNEQGTAQAPFNNNPQVRIVLDGNAEVDEELIVPFDPIKLIGTRNSFQNPDWDLNATSIVDLLNEKDDEGDYLRLTEYNLNPLNSDGDPLCDVALEANDDRVPYYATLTIDVQTGTNPVRSSGFATLRYDSTVATWWYSEEGFEIKGEQNCEGQLELTNVTYEYDLEIEPGWNVVFSTVTPEDPEEFAAEDGYTYLRTLITTATPDPNDVPFLYWRTTVDLTRDTSLATGSVADRGSTATEILGAVATCADGETCGLTDLLNASAGISLRSVIGDVPIHEDSTDPIAVDDVRMVPSGTFDIYLPADVVPVITVSGTTITIDTDSFDPELLLPRADIFQAASGGACGIRTIPSTTDFAVQSKLEFFSIEGTMMGNAYLRGSSNNGGTTKNVEWIYASADMDVSWVTSGTDYCIFTPPVGVSATDQRQIKLDMSLELEEGWNMVLRTSETPSEASAPQEFTWEIISTVPTDVTWVADVNRIPSTAAVAASRIGVQEGAYLELMQSLQPNEAPEDARRGGRSIIRTFIENRP